ncbi:hypothetical protein RYX36_017122 [Vicia faba]
MNPSKALLSPISKPKKKRDYINKDKNIRYTSNNMILLKTAMKNSMKNEGGMKATFANNMVIKSKRVSPKQCCIRRQNFQTTPSRLSIVSTVQEDLSISSMSSNLSIKSPAQEDLFISPRPSKFSIKSP